VTIISVGKKQQAREKVVVAGENAININEKR